MSEVRVRMAPSPTGRFHIGSARTLLFNYLFARNQDGKLVLRIEDTDQERSEERYTQNILQAIDWLGLDYDEGPDKDGGYGPYFQMERLDLYTKYAEQLIDQGLAYHCYMTSEELEEERQQQIAAGEPPKYSGQHRHLTSEQKQQFETEGRKPAIRFVVPEKEVVFQDAVKGKIRVDSSIFGDWVIVKSDGVASYNFANVVDDALMQISHVLRGEDHISNTSRQILMYEALGFSLPTFGHLPMILNPDKTKMSKRSGPTAVTDYRESGYLTEAVVNFLALLGWAPEGDQEMFSLKELEQAFSLNHVHKSPAVFNLDKLKWFNGQYIRKQAEQDQATLEHQLLERVKEAYANESPRANDAKYFSQIFPLCYERLQFLQEIVEQTDFFYLEAIEYDPELLLDKKRDAAKATVILQAAKEVLALPDLSWEKETIETTLKTLVEGEEGYKPRDLFMTLRIATTGTKASPPLFDTLAVLGREWTLARMEKAIGKLAENS